MSNAHNLQTLFTSSGIAASTEQLKQLEHYHQLVLEWNRKLNLIAGSTLPDFMRRHVLDSAQLTKYLPKAPCHILDIGSGAGLPGLVLATLCPQHKFTLAEIIQKKSSFLITAAYKMGLKNVTVHAANVQTLPAASADIITARAVAALADLLDLSDAQLKPGGEWLLLKGQAAEQEINALNLVPRWADALTIQRHRSIVETTGSVLVLKRV